MDAIRPKNIEASPPLDWNLLAEIKVSAWRL